MRFAVVGPTYPIRGGIAHHTTLLCRHLAQRHQVHLVSFQPRGFSRLLRGLKGYDPSRTPLRPEGEGLHCEYLLDPLDPFSWRRAAQRIWVRPPDALLLPWWTVVWLPAWVYLAHYSHGQGAPIVYLCHDVIPRDPIPGKASLAQLALKHGDAFIVHSEGQAQVLEQLLGDVLICYVPFPRYESWAESVPSRVQARQALDLAEGEPTLLFFGLVRPYKGLADLLHALAQVRQTLPVRLLVAGEFWENIATYQRLVNTLGLDSAVRFYNRYIPDEEVPLFFAAADAVVLPYRQASQSAAAALAQALGKPVIATRVGGLPEMIADGQTGLLVPPGDPQALADTILRFYREGLGPINEAALTTSREAGSWDQFVMAIESLARQMTSHRA
ncbi:MAG: glycosyl transferase family 1 [Chloroflexota bacterium]